MILKFPSQLTFITSIYPIFLPSMFLFYLNKNPNSIELNYTCYEDGLEIVTSYTFEK